MHLCRKYTAYVKSPAFTPKGFTMLEMSIVLVIIGLLVAGITLGQELIRQYEIRKSIIQIDRFRTAINSFHSQFDGLPGDLRNAEDFWGSNATGTQNGDGNTLIEFVNDDGVFEGYRAWQQLALADLLEGNYSGTETTGAPELVFDLPISGLGGGYALEHDTFGLAGQLVLLLGNPLAGTTTMLMEGAIKPLTAFELDEKMDDGMPSTGVVRGADGEGNLLGNCIDTAGNDSEYDLTKTTNDCIIGIQL